MPKLDTQMFADFVAHYVFLRDLKMSRQLDSVAEFTEKTTNSSARLLYVALMRDKAAQLDEMRLSRVRFRFCIKKTCLNPTSRSLRECPVRAMLVLSSSQFHYHHWLAVHSFAFCLLRWHTAPAILRAAMLRQVLALTICR